MSSKSHEKNDEIERACALKVPTLKTSQYPRIARMQALCLIAFNSFSY